MKSTTDTTLLHQSITSRREEIQAEIGYLKAAVSELEKLIRYKEGRLKALNDLSDDSTPSLSLADSADTDIPGGKDLKTPEKGREFLHCVDSIGKNVHVNDTVSLTPSKKGKFAGVSTGKVVGLYKGKERILSIEVQLEVPVSETKTKQVTEYTWRESRTVTIDRKNE